MINKKEWCFIKLVIRKIKLGTQFIKYFNIKNFLLIDWLFLETSINYFNFNNNLEF